MKRDSRLSLITDHGELRAVVKGKRGDELLRMFRERRVDSWCVGDQATTGWVDEDEERVAVRWTYAFAELDWANKQVSGSACVCVCVCAWLGLVCLVGLVEIESVVVVVVDDDDDGDETKRD